MNMTKAKMDKLTGILRNKNNHAEECKNNYVLFLEETNKKQDQHYTSQMPEVMTVSVWLVGNQLGKQLGKLVKTT